MLDANDSPTEKEALQSKVDDLKKLWDEVTGKVDSEKYSEDTILGKCKDADDKMKDLEKFLTEQEEKLRSLEPVACSHEKLDQQQKEINVSISRHLFNGFLTLISAFRNALKMFFLCVCSY